MKNISYINKLYKGQVPLYITFWFWFVIFSFILNFFIGINFSEIQYNAKNISTQDFFLYTLSLIYSIFIFIALIKSANNYKKSKFISFFAKVIVTVSLMFSLMKFIDLTKIKYFEDYTISLEINSLKDELPIMVNSYTKLENIEKNEKSILYTYKILKENIHENKNVKLNRFKKDVQDSLCDDDNTLRLLKKDYILDYNYVDLNDKKIVSIVTNKQSCGPGIYDYDILKELFVKEGLL